MINMPKWPWFNALSKSSLAFLYISNCFGPNGLWGCVAVTCSSSLVTKWELRAKWESGKILRIFQMWSKAHTGLTERWERDFEPSSSLREIPWPFIYKAHSHPETWKWENEKISNCSDLLENWHGLCLICQYYVCKVGKLYLWSPVCENILQVSSLKATRVASLKATRVAFWEKTQSQQILMINMPKWPWFNALSKSSLVFLYISNCFGSNGLWGFYWWKHLISCIEIHKTGITISHLNNSVQRHEMNSTYN